MQDGHFVYIDGAQETKRQNNAGSSSRTISLFCLVWNTFVQWRNLYCFEWGIKASLPPISFLVILRQDIAPINLPNQGYDPLLVSKIEVIVIGG